MRNYLITGASGHIGEHVLLELSKDLDIHLYCPVRAKTFSKIGDSLSLKYPNITFFSCELNDSELMEKVADVDFEGIVHLAGLYDLDGKKGDLFLSNVVSTMAICRFCNLKEISRFLLISTVAVAGKSHETLKEEKIEKTPLFYNEYERTKFIAEDFVSQSLHPNCAYTVMRPGIVLGSAFEEREIKLDGPYYVIKNIDRFSLALKKMLFITIPYSEKSILPFTNIDMISCAISSWVREIKNYQQFYNVVFDNNPKVSTFLSRVLKSFGIKAKLVRLNYIKHLDKLFPFVNIPKNLYDYLFYAPVIINDNFVQDFGSYRQDFEAYYDSFIANYKKQTRKDYNE